MVLKRLSNVYPLYSIFKPFFKIFLSMRIHDQITSEIFGSDIAQKAQTKVERNWRESERTIGRLGVIPLNCNSRWEGSVEY